MLHAPTSLIDQRINTVLLAKHSLLLHNCHNPPQEDKKLNSLQHFLAQLKRAQLRRQSKQTSQVTTKVASSTASSTVTTHTKVADVKMSDDIYRTLIVTKAIHHIKQRGV